MSKLSDINMALEKRLERLLAHYRESAQALVRLRDAEPLNSGTDRLQALLFSIESNQSEYQAAVSLWNATGFVPTKRCRALREEVQSALEGLMTIVDELESKARSSKDMLLPQLSQAALIQQAQSAYRSTQSL